jgi:hypothetical protein
MVKGKYGENNLLHQLILQAHGLNRGLFNYIMKNKKNQSRKTHKNADLLLSLPTQTGN